MGARTATNERKHNMSTPNYRVYDRTGGGAATDIYAESEEAAVEAGREWIEDGNWSSDDGVIRKGIRLDCEVRPIMRTVYYVDMYRSGQERNIQGPFGTLDDARNALSVGEEEASVDLYEGVVEEIGGRWPRAVVEMVEAWDAECASDVDTIYSVTGQDVKGEVNDAATNDQDPIDCSGSYSDEEPTCDSEGPGDDEGGHDWRSPHSLVGGLKENPGTRSLGGTTMQFKYVCACCGKYRTETHKGSQRHDDDPESTVEYADADDDSREWLVRVHEEDGWIPTWLAEQLDRPPTTRYTEEEAKEYVAHHYNDDDYEHDEDTLEHVFAALYGNRPYDQYRAEGLWSHICAAV